MTRQLLPVSCQLSIMSFKVVGYVGFFSAFGCWHCFCRLCCVVSFELLALFVVMIVASFVCCHASCYGFVVFVVMLVVSVVCC